MVVCVYRQTSPSALAEWEATSLPALLAALGTPPHTASAHEVYNQFRRFSERHPCQHVASGLASAATQPGPPAPAGGTGSALSGQPNDPSARPFLQGRVSRFKLSAGRRDPGAAPGAQGVLWGAGHDSGQPGNTGNGTTMSLSTAASGSTFASQNQNISPIPQQMPVTSTPLAGLGFVQHSNGPTFAAEGFQVDKHYKPNIKTSRPVAAASHTRPTAGSQQGCQHPAADGGEQPVAIGKVGSNFTVGFRERDCDGSVAGGGIGSQYIGQMPLAGPRSSASVALGPVGDGILTADTQPEDSAFVAASLNSGQQQYAEEISLAPLLQDMYPDYAQPPARRAAASAAAAALADMTDSEDSNDASASGSTPTSAAL